MLWLGGVKFRKFDLCSFKLPLIAITLSKGLQVVLNIKGKIISVESHIEARDRESCG